MAKSTKLCVMLSSRCNDKFPAGGATTLTNIRKELKAEIEAMEIAGRKAFEVWINEDAPPAGGTWDSWDVCIQAVKACDILIVVSNGDAGWGAWSIESGWTQAWLVSVLALRERGSSLWDASRSPTMGRALEHWTAEMVSP